MYLTFCHSATFQGTFNVLCTCTILFFISLTSFDVLYVNTVQQYCIIVSNVVSKTDNRDIHKDSHSKKGGLNKLRCLF